MLYSDKFAVLVSIWPMTTQGFYGYIVLYCSTGLELLLSGSTSQLQRVANQLQQPEIVYIHEYSRVLQLTEQNQALQHNLNLHPDSPSSAAPDKFYSA